MPRHEDAPQLRSVGQDASGRDAQLAPSAANAWQGMRQAAETDGVALLLVSAFRSAARQRQLLESHLAAGRPWAEILSVAAYPGFSEHHTGRAIDLGAPGQQNLTEAFATTPQFHWLTANAGRFHFSLTYPRDNPFGIAYEPWHWCFIPAPASQSA
jgi:D-alanyl-D-alanine carboxypeptidase